MTAHGRVTENLALMTEAADLLSVNADKFEEQGLVEASEVTSRAAANIYARVAHELDTRGFTDVGKDAWIKAARAYRRARLVGNAEQCEDRARAMRMSLIHQGRNVYDP